MCDQALSDAILDWYESHGRTLPWRVRPAEARAGAAPDPYRVWLSEIMLQQTTVAAVTSYFATFTERWPTVVDLAQADDAEVMAAWAGLGYYARARNLLRCARAVVDAHDGAFPENRDALQNLPGIGPYTSAAIAAIAFGKPETVVDGNVERVMARLTDEHTPLPAAKPILTAHATRLTPLHMAGDYAQAVMDLGATVCTPRRPRCEACPWASACLARARGTAADLPRKAPKVAKPVRQGTVFIAVRVDGAWLLETRPERGLLGGMLGWPGTAWSDPPPDPQGAAPVDADWRRLPADVRHTFTHFHLRLRVLAAQVGHGARPARGRFYAPAEFTRTDLPTVMRKAYDLAAPLLAGGGGELSVYTSETDTR